MKDRLCTPSADFGHTPPPRIAGSWGRVAAGVRLRYVGTIREVADAFQRAASRVSTEHLADIVMSVQYVYPYQQSLGFLLERAGVPSPELEPLRRLRSTFQWM